MNSIKRMIPYCIAVAAAFYLLPLLGSDTGNFIVILLILIPVICFAAALTLGMNNGFFLLFPIVAAVLFAPAIFIYFNSSAWIYCILYAGVSLAGVGIGGLIFRKKMRQVDVSETAQLEE